MKQHVTLDKDGRSYTWHEKTYCGLVVTKCHRKLDTAVHYCKGCKFWKSTKKCHSCSPCAECVKNGRKNE